jgi:acyl-CoA reductase-like NAD-dependent aldehyde dehydrogenase
MLELGTAHTTPSGLGREGSRHGMDEFTDLKYLCIDVVNT